MSNTPRIDWFRVIEDIQRSGVGQAEIGIHVGRSQTQIAHYKSIPDTEPRFHVGMLLLELWAQCTGKTPASWPYIDGT